MRYHIAINTPYFSSLETSQLSKNQSPTQYEFELLYNLAL